MLKPVVVVLEVAALNSQLFVISSTSICTYINHFYIYNDCTKVYMYVRGRNVELVFLLSEYLSTFFIYLSHMTNLKFT